MILDFSFCLSLWSCQNMWVSRHLKGEDISSLHHTELMAIEEALDAGLAAVRKKQASTIFYSNKNVYICLLIRSDPDIYIYIYIYICIEGLIFLHSFFFNVHFWVSFRQMEYHSMLEQNVCRLHTVSSYRDWQDIIASILLASSYHLRFFFFPQNKTSESPALCLTIFFLTENFQEKMLDEEFKRLQFVLV